MLEFRYSSKSSDKTHVTTVSDDGVVRCTCSGYIFNRKCWHVTDVNQKIADGQIEKFWEKDKNITVHDEPVQVSSEQGNVQTVDTAKAKEMNVADGPKKARFRSTHGYDLFLLLSALHKSVRKGMEYEACHFAMEIASTGKSQFSMVVNYLETMVHEDVGIGDMQVGTYVMTTCQHMRQFYERKRELPDMALCNAIVALCRARKDHTGVCLAMLVEGEQKTFGCIPKIPDCAYDMHTQQGRKMGRGKRHFLDECFWNMANEVPNQEYREQWEHGFLHGWTVDPDDMERPPATDEPSLFDGLEQENP